MFMFFYSKSRMFLNSLHHFLLVVMLVPFPHSSVIPAAPLSPIHSPTTRLSHASDSCLDAVTQSRRGGLSWSLFNPASQPTSHTLPAILLLPFPALPWVCSGVILSCPTIPLTTLSYCIQSHPTQNCSDYILPY